MKIIIIIFSLVIVLTTAGIYFFTGKDATELVTPPVNQTGLEKTVAPITKTAIREPLKCTHPDPASKSIRYIADNKILTENRQFDDGTIFYELLINGASYSWSNKLAGVGSYINFGAADPGYQETYVARMYDPGNGLGCQPWIADMSKFEIPKDINFPK